MLDESHSSPEPNETIWERDRKNTKEPDVQVIIALSFFFIMVILVCIGIYVLERRRDLKYRRKIAEEE